MAGSAEIITSTSDKQPFRNFTAMVQRERELIDGKKRLEDEVKWLDQTLSYLTLTSATPAAPNSIPAQAVVKAIEERKKKITNTVSQQ